MMVAESLFGSVQYGDVKVRFEPAPPPGDAYFYAEHNPNESHRSSPLQTLASPPPDCPSEEQLAAAKPLLSQQSASGLDTRKDDGYWDRRRRNNEAAKRSREKRRFNDMVLERRVAELTKDNYLMRAQLNTIRDKFGIIGEHHIDAEQVLAQVPPVERILGFGKRPKPLSTATAGLLTSAAAAVGFSLMPSSSVTPAASTAEFRPRTPPSAPVMSANGREPAPFVYRQQSLLEGRRPEPRSVYDTEPWQPCSADATQRLTPPDFSAAVNLTKPTCLPCSPAGEPRVISPPADAASCLPLKLRHKSHLGHMSPPRPPHVKEEPHDSAASSGDEERDSGYSDRYNSDGGGGRAASPTVKRRRWSAAEPPPVGGQIHSELERLSSEVASLRSLFRASQPATADA